MYSEQLGLQTNIVKVISVGLDMYWFVFSREVPVDWVCYDTLKMHNH